MMAKVAARKLAPVIVEPDEHGTVNPATDTDCQFMDC